MGASEVRQASRWESLAPGAARSLSLRANFAWTLFGNVVYAGCQWAMLMALAKLGSAETVGRFALALAVTAPVLMLTNLQLRNIQATDALREYRFGEYLALRLVMTGLALLVILGLAGAWGDNASVAGVILVIGIAKCFESISDVIYGAMQQHERMDKLAISMSLRGVISLTALALGVYFTGDLLWGTIGLALSWLLVLLVYDLPNAARVIRTGESNTRPTHPLRPVWSASRLIALSRLSLPLGFVMLLISLNTNIPRYFIEHFLGTRDLGFFAAVAYITLIGNTLVNALGTSASPKLSRYYAAGDTKSFVTMLAKPTGVGILIGVIGVAVAWVAGPEILRLLYSSEYASYSNVLVWTMVAGGIAYAASVLGFGMTAARSFKAQALLFGLVTVAAIVFLALLIPAYQLVGAALAIALAALLQLAGSFLVLVRALAMGDDRRQTTDDRR